MLPLRTCTVLDTVKPGTNADQDLRAACIKVADKLFRMGFRDKRDLAFGVMYAAVGSVGSTTDLKNNCLGDSLSSAAESAHFWNALPDDLNWTLKPVSTKQ